MTKIEITTPITLQYVKGITKEELHDLIIMLCEQADRAEQVGYKKGIEDTLNANQEHMTPNEYQIARLAAVQAFAEKLKKMMPKWWHMTSSDIKRLNQDIDQLVEEERGK